MIYSNVEELIAYGLKNKLIEKEDEIWARNSILALLNLPDNNNAAPYKGPLPDNPGEILSDISFYASENGLLEAATSTYREIFETSVMAVFTKRPSEVSKIFYDTWHEKGIKKANSEFYKYCRKIY